MPLSRLDPRCALLVIDLQRGIVSLPAVQPAAAAVVAHAAVLARAFRRQHRLVVLVNVDGAPPGRTGLPPRTPPPPGWSELLPELEAQPDDLRITKRTWGAFTGTGLATRLRRRGVTQTVLAGIATSIGVESTAREAHALGFNVVLAVDAMTDLDADAHAGSVRRIFPRLGETATCAEILMLLDASGAAEPRG